MKRVALAATAALAVLACTGCGAEEEQPVAPPGSVERVVARQERADAAAKKVAIEEADVRAEAQADADIKRADAYEAERVKGRP